MLHSIWRGGGHASFSDDPPKAVSSYQHGGTHIVKLDSLDYDDTAQTGAIHYEHGARDASQALYESALMSYPKMSLSLLCI